MPQVSNLRSSAACISPDRRPYTVRPRQQLAVQAFDVSHGHGPGQGQGVPSAGPGSGSPRRRRKYVPKTATLERISVDTALESSIHHMSDSLNNDGFAFCPSSEAFALLSDVGGVRLVPIDPRIS